MGISEVCAEGLSTFLKIERRARCGAPKLQPRLFKQAPSYSPPTQ